MTRKLKVLVVEDDPVQRRWMVKSLPADVFETFQAGNMADALASLAAAKFDGVVLDLLLPDVDQSDPTQAVSLIKDAYPSVAVVAITALGIETMESAIARGAYGWLEKNSKPLSAEDGLVSMLWQAIHNSSVNCFHRAKDDLACIRQATEQGQAQLNEMTGSGERPIPKELRP